MDNIVNLLEQLKKEINDFNVGKKKTAFRPSCLLKLYTMSYELSKAEKEIEGLHKSDNHIWTGEYRNIRFKISHHGKSEYNPDGIWCYYIYIDPEQYSEEEYEKFKCPSRVDNSYGEYIKYHDYYKLEDLLDFHGGITWYKEIPSDSCHDSRFRPILEIGCDYNHLWDQEYGYSLADIHMGVKGTIDHMLDMFNPMVRSKYSGKYYKEEDTYVARNDLILGKEEAEILPEGWDSWLPKEDFNQEKENLND